MSWKMMLIAVQTVKSLYTRGIWIPSPRGAEVTERYEGIA